MYVIVKLGFFLCQLLTYAECMMKTRLQMVEEAYSEIARRPGDDHPFPVGRELAEALGYPPDLLQGLPSACIEAFAGVSNVSVFAELDRSDIVLDLGCGAGLDLLVAAGRGAGKLLGVDFSWDMLERAQQAVESAAQEHKITLLHSPASDLPLLSASLDAVMVNGIFNLNPERPAVFHELRRVLRPGGVAFVAELILTEPLPDELRDNANWLA